MQSIQALRERIAARAQEVRSLVEKSNDKWTPEAQATYDAGMAEIEDLKGQVSRIEASASAMGENRQIEQIVDAAGKKGGSRAAEFYDKFLRNGDKAFSASDWQEIRDACELSGLSLVAWALPMMLSKARREKSKGRKPVADRVKK